MANDTTGADDAVTNSPSGPLRGLRVIELAGIGPGPMCAMLLADLGAEVVRVDRLVAEDLGIDRGRKFTVLNRGRRSIGVDLKSEAGVETVLRLVDDADALIEGFRPGVTERLGLGPEVCHARNPKLVYGRMTGWGQDGPLAPAAGHDINYIALTGALHAIGTEGGPPVPPLNLVGDFGGGALYLAFGVCAALLHAKASGEGQVVDAAMTDGASSLMASVYGLSASGGWADDRGINLLDTGAHFYGTYKTSDDKYVAIGSIERRFHDILMDKLGLDDAEIPNRMDTSRWREWKSQLADLFRQKTRDEWCAIMEGTDICFAPVLSLNEAPEHPHNKARGTFIEVEGVTQPGPAPRFSATPGAVQRPPAKPGEHTTEVLTDWGFSSDELDALRADGAIG